MVQFLDPEIVEKVDKSFMRTTSSLRCVFGVDKYLICGSKAEKDPRPVLKKGQSEDKYLHFKKQLVRYRMESNLVVDQIRDQLLAYAAGRTIHKEALY